MKSKYRNLLLLPWLAVLLPARVAAQEPPRAPEAAPEVRQPTRTAGDDKAALGSATRKSRLRKPKHGSPKRVITQRAPAPVQVASATPASAPIDPGPPGVEEAPEPDAIPEERDEADTARARDPANEDDRDCGPDPDKRLCGGAELSFDSRHLWRGLALTRGPVLQPSAWASAYGLTAIVWTTFALQDEPPSDHLRSVVPSVSYAYVWKRWKLEPGALLYWSHDDVRPDLTAEAFVNLSLRLGPFHLANTTNIDVMRYPGAYFGTIGPVYEAALGNFTFKTSVELGWAAPAFNAAYFGRDVAAVNVVMGGVETRYDFTSVFFATVHGEACTLVDAALRSSVSEPTLASLGASFGADI